MNCQKNKEVAQELFDSISEGNIEAAANLMSDDISWWISGKASELPFAGVYDKEGLKKLFNRMNRQLLNGLKMTVKSSIAEGDKVAMEVESYGELKNGRVYNQQYHFLITIVDAKIANVKEYLDTQHVYSVWVKQ